MNEPRNKSSESNSPQKKPFYKTKALYIFLLIALLSFIFNKLYELIDINLIAAYAEKFDFLPIIAVSIFFATGLSYLQSGFKTDKKDVSLNQDENSRVFKRLAHQDEELKSLNSKVESLSSQFTLSPDEKARLLFEIADGTKKEIIEDIFEIKSREFIHYVENEATSERLAFLTSNIRKRLDREISDLRLRANINLMIGMSITILGLLLLWTIVYTIDSSEMLKSLALKGDESNIQFLKNLILPLLPRVMLVIFIEVFAYFFLKLYKNGLNEIKYFQNELTNIESKMVALEMAHMSNNSSAISNVIEYLVKTERNFVLRRGETTVELEKAKSESDMMRNLISAIPKLFTKK